MLTSMLSGSKRYIAIGELGKATDTLDSTGKVTDEKPYDKITREDIEGILQKFTGNILQVPPLYSALKQGGQRLSALMKRGEAVEARPARPVTVHSISLLSFQPPLFTLDVECGGGFYIRSLVNDIGRGSPAYTSCLAIGCSALYQNNHSNIFSHSVRISHSSREEEKHSGEEEYCYKQPGGECLPDPIMDTRAALLTPESVAAFPRQQALELKVTLQKERERFFWILAHFQLSEES